MTDENLAQRHRHGAAWTGEPEPEHNPRAWRWMIVGLVAFWVCVILLVRSCG